jgi:diguanylate cyclase
LKETARRLEKCVRKVDTVARMSGDEFIIVIPDLSDSADLLSIGNHILQRLAKPYDVNGAVLTVSASIGVSIYPSDAADMQSLIRNADSAMYHAKKKGRNRFQFYTDEMNRRALEAMAFENRVRDALRRNEFEVHYQPQVEITSGQIVGLEALLRWRDTANDWVSPEKIIPLAEERGLIEPIFEWVLHTACEQNRRWQKAGLLAVPVAVNICAWQIRQQDLIKKITSALDHSGLDSRFLELELTESMLMQEVEATIAMVRELRNIGMKLSIDDFGTGYSSLSYLRQLPIHKLKIAHPFISDIPGNPDAAAITSAIISMAKSLKLRALAEGVETEEQLAFLKSQCCDEIQGFYFSEALSPDRCAEMLRHGLPSTN